MGSLGGAPIPTQPSPRHKCAPWSPQGARPGAGAALTQDVALAERAGLLEEKPGVHAVPVKFVGAGQHPQPLWEGKRSADVGGNGQWYRDGNPASIELPEGGG